MTDSCGAYEDEDLCSDLFEILSKGWLRVWDIRYAMRVGEDTTK